MPPFTNCIGVKPKLTKMMVINNATQNVSETKDETFPSRTRVICGFRGSPAVNGRTHTAKRMFRKHDRFGFSELQKEKI